MDVESGKKLDAEEFVALGLFILYQIPLPSLRRKHFWAYAVRSWVRNNKASNVAQGHNLLILAAMGYFAA